MHGKPKIRCDLQEYEARYYSQNGEDGVLQRIFQLVGTNNKYFVEFGVGSDGSQCNTRYLEEKQGWQGLRMDCDASEGQPRVKRELIRMENINALFSKYEVPWEFDLLSIDIDGNDYWIWKEVDSRYRPRALILEYNASIPPTESKTIEYDPSFRWQRTDYYGAGLLALERLSRRKGYTLCYCEQRGINAFFIRSDLCPFEDRPIDEIHRPPDYAGGSLWGLGRLYWPQGVGFKRDKNRTMISVE